MCIRDRPQSSSFFTSFITGFKDFVLVLNRSFMLTGLTESFLLIRLVSHILYKNFNASSWVLHCRMLIGINHCYRQFYLQRESLIGLFLGETFKNYKNFLIYIHYKFNSTWYPHERIRSKGGCILVFPNYYLLLSMSFLWTEKKFVK